jgi:hypothetical protein
VLNPEPYRPPLPTSAPSSERGRSQKGYLDISTTSLVNMEDD